MNEESDMIDEHAPSYHDLAGWYDAIYDARGKDYAAEAEAILALARESGAAPRSLLDVACGTGRHLAVFAEQVVAVAGADSSTEMLTIAASRLSPEVELIEADLRSLALGRTFDAVTCLFSSIGHIEDEDELDRAVAAMAQHVGARGTLAIEPWLTPDAVVPGGVRDVVTAKTDDGVVARAGSSQPDGDALLVSFAWAVATASGVATLKESHRMPLFTRERYLQAVTAAGLEAQWLDSVPGLGLGRGLLVGRRR